MNGSFSDFLCWLTKVGPDQREKLFHFRIDPKKKIPKFSKVPFLKVFSMTLAVWLTLL